MFQGSSQTRYTEDDQRRFVAERGRAGRSDFQRDHARLVHSAAFRRLAAKTQVVVAGEHDFPRTRLTHSLECAQVGREMAVALGSDPDVVEVACLAHDVGHPPFGHNGEAALNEIAAEWGGFEGNAQSFRILTHTEAKRFDAAGRSVGLNLTRACLDAATKYPWPQQQTGPDGSTQVRAKFGVYAQDLAVFDWMREGAPAGQRCFEAQIMDWSDDVAYSAHDVEDAVHLGLLSLEKVSSGDGADHVIAVAQQRFGTDPQQAALALEQVVALPEWVAAASAQAASRTTAASTSGAGALAASTWQWGVPPSGTDAPLLPGLRVGTPASREAMAALKNLTSRLIGRFARGVELATREQYGDGDLLRYQAQLVIPAQLRAQCDVLKAVSAIAMMLGPHASARYEQQRQVVQDLVQAFAQSWLRSPDPVAQADLDQAGDESARMRAVVDTVASLTDTSALALHHQLRGTRA